MRMPLLQVDFYRTQNDWKTMVILGGIIAVVVIALVLYGKAHPGGSKSGRYSRRAFRKEAAAIGLTKVQIRLLESFIRNYQVRQPFKLLSNTQELRITLGKALRDIQHVEGKEATVEDRKLEIYRIQQRIDLVFADTNRMADTKQLRLGQNVTFQQENGNRFTSVITANLKEFYCAQVPMNLGGEQVKWRKGTKIKLYIWGIDGEEMVFESKILGYTNVKRITSVMLQHTKRVSRAVQRKFRRSPFKGQCTFYPVRIVEKGTGRRTTRQAVVVTNQMRMGTMIDLSAGGCALASHKPLPRGELIKITFEPQRGEPITAFGKIVDSRMVNRTRTTLHVMFTRASSKNLNKINELVYNFS